MVEGLRAVDLYHRGTLWGRGRVSTTGVIVENVNIQAVRLLTMNKPPSQIETRIDDKPTFYNVQQPPVFNGKYWVSILKRPT
ncbi:MAG: hypothetical protein QNK37_20700 [Acidobacteriota bacterium]|nr:hypothetical protein [Acidobacteriota bacterium]